MLSRDDLVKIDRAAKDLLENPGVCLEDEEIVGLMLEHGAKPGARSDVVRIPRKMVDEYVAIAPSSVAFASRQVRPSSPQHTSSLVVEPDSASRFWTGAAMFYLDNNGFRPIGSRELADFTRVVDALPGVDAVVGTAIDDVPPRCRDFIGMHLMARNTCKHLRALCFTSLGGEAMIEMGAVLADGSMKDAPVFSIGFTAHGPLRWTSLALGIFKSTAGHGIPATINGEPMAGASSPVTLAGTAAVGTAEILAGIVVNQILEPGRPCLFNLGFSHVFDMRNAFAVTGGPENAILATAGAELARYYDVPSVSWMCTDSLGYDEQNSLEKTFAALSHAAAGLSIVWGVGQAESEKTLSPIQAVVDDEIIGMTRRFTDGMRVDEESLAVDEVREAGICGNFLATEHTRTHYRDELFDPTLLHRSMRGEGADQQPANTRHLLERATARVESILRQDPVSYLSTEQERELQCIEDTYSARLSDS